MATEILALDEVTTSQSAKETTVNTAHRQLEAQLIRVLSRTTTAQPGSPAAGDVYLLGASPTGAQWSTQANKLAHYFGGAWVFYTAKEGMNLWVNDEDVRIRYNGSAWDIIDALPRLPVLSKTSNYTVLTTDRGRVIFADTTSGTITLTLPAVASAGDGFVIAAVKTVAANSLIFDGNASETINGSTTLTLTDQHDSRILVCNGSVWRTVGGGGSGGGGGGVTLPISDVNTLFKNESDATKTLKFSLASIATATDRTATWPNKNITVAGLDDVVAGGNGSNALGENGPHNGLFYSYAAGLVRQDNSVVAVPGGSVLVTEGATNYIEVDSAGSVSANTTGFTAGRFPMATVTTVAGSPSAIDVVTDKRSWVLCISAASGPTLGTPTSASGTAVDFTGIPSATKKISVSITGLSTNGTSAIILQIGDSGGIETTGYSGSHAIISSTITRANLSSGFFVSSGPAATNVYYGTLELSLLDSSTNTWSCTGSFGLSDAAVVLITAGTKALSATLDRVRLTMANGTDTFDAGTINILYQ